MKKVVLKLEFADEKTKQKAMQKVSGISGVESISIDPKDKKLTITGDVDPVSMVAKLRKLCYTEIVSVGPAKEPEKKKEEPKKDDAKKVEDDKKKEDNKKKEDAAQILKAYQAYQQQLQYNNPYNYQQHAAAVPQSYYNRAPQAYFNRSSEEDPNSCVIC